MKSQNTELIELRRGKPGYPASLTERMVKSAPAALWVLGDAKLLQENLVGLFCSVRCPGNEILKLYDVARGLRDAGVGVVSGFHTPMEKECLVTLLRGTQPIVICPARSLHKMRVPPDWASGIRQGRIALVSTCPPAIRRATKETAVQRNRLVAAIANGVLIAYAEPGGHTARIADELTKAGRPPWTLASPPVTPFLQPST